MSPMYPPVAASTRPPETLSAGPIFSCFGSSVIVTGHPPVVISLPSATDSLWIFPSGETA